MVKSGWLRAVCVGLAVAGFFVFSGCPLVSPIEWRLYSLGAGGGAFIKTDNSYEYRLYTTAVDALTLWFSDRPLRNAGTEPTNGFKNVTWDMWVGPGKPTGGVATRSADGVWSILPAQFLGAEFVLNTQDMYWVLKTEGTPDFSNLTGTVVYLDDKSETDIDAETHVFLHAAASGAFTMAKAAAASYTLTLEYPMDEVIKIAVAPGDQAVVEPLGYFVDTTWPAGFAADSPNAAVTIEGPDGEVVTTPVTLSNPQWDGVDTLTYDAVPLGGFVPPAFEGPAILFIDSYEDQDDQTIYVVVVNHEEYYSIWPADRELPLGWNNAGKTGTKQECLDYIEVIWTDMRPLSLRKKMEEMANSN